MIDWRRSEQRCGDDVHAWEMCLPRPVDVLSLSWIKQKEITNDSRSGLTKSQVIESGSPGVLSVTVFGRMDLSLHISPSYTQGPDYVLLCLDPILVARSETN